MRFFVTGASGFIGRHLVPRLEALGEVETLKGDLLDAAALRGARDADAVVHLAAQAAPLKGEEDALATVRANVVGTVNVAAAARPDARLVFASTAQVYAPSTTPVSEHAALAPISVYGHTKLAAEHALLAMARRGPLPVVLRLFNVYGRGQSETYVVGRLIEALRRGETPTLGAPHPVRDFVHVDDVVEAMVRAATTPLDAPHVLNVGTGVGTSIEGLARATGREVRFAGGARAADTNHLVADVAWIRQVLGWEAQIPLRDGLARCLLDGH